jgi:hypothetical protein
MKMPVSKYAALVLLIAVSWQAGARGQESKTSNEPDANSPAGVWRGESLCTSGAPSCHDEKVVYYIEAIPEKTDAMQIRADKIVDGKAITMGSGPWQYNRAKHTLSMGTAERLWLLKIDGKRIDGTLTVPDNVVFRRMTLAKD